MWRKQQDAYRLIVENQTQIHQHRSVMVYLQTMLPDPSLFHTATTLGSLRFSTQSDSGCSGLCLGAFSFEAIHSPWKQFPLPFAFGLRYPTLFHISTHMHTALYRTVSYCINC